MAAMASPSCAPRWPRRDGHRRAVAAALRRGAACAVAAVLASAPLAADAHTLEALLRMSLERLLQLEITVRASWPAEPPRGR